MWVLLLWELVIIFILKLLGYFFIKVSFKLVVIIML